jgi:hypothetical protein
MRFVFSAIVLSALFEGGLQWWMRRDIQASIDPVFSYPPALEASAQIASDDLALRLYKADRGGEVRIDAGKGKTLQVIYYEKLRVESKVAGDFAKHAPEVCNTRLGFEFIDSSRSRSHQAYGEDLLSFDATHFEDPTGRPTFVFKCAWIQGYGNWLFRRDEANLWERFSRRLVRTAGAGRMLLIAVSGVNSMDEAWALAEERVLDDLVWQSKSDSGL